MLSIHSDDFGYKYYTDKKVIHLVKRGKIQSLSVISNMVDKKNLSALAIIAKEKHLNIGLHLNLIEGKSMDKKEYIPTLVNKRGEFYPLALFMVKLFLGLIDRKHIEREITKQIEFIKNAGVKVKFINSHQHIHALSPVAEIVAEIAQKQKIKVVSSYKKIRTYTLVARIKHLILKIAAMSSYLIIHHQRGLPVSWNTKSEDSFSFMSWEGARLDISQLKEKNLVLVTHPFLPFDTNRSYMWFLI